ncbi:MAG: ATP-binding cassette domain-containing protein [Bdellovibrionales bacterium]|nr:ATP-binding cassette domain-containing protein [Bdellovibrionales bacterium]
MSEAVEIKNLKKTFDNGKHFVLNGIDLSIPRGTITVIIGYSGTGKSVLLKHILGLLEPTLGSICVLDHYYEKMSGLEKAQLRKKFGVLFQHAALFDDMTAIENAMFPLIEHRKDLSRDQMKTIASQKLVDSGLDPRHFDKLPSEISGGMRKRVGLARALALEPEILLYDEPTTGLDPILTEMVDNLIYETHHKQGDKATSIVISHDLSAAFRLADKIVMLHEGKVLKSGTADDFLNSDHEFIRLFVDKGMRR